MIWQKSPLVIWQKSPLVTWQILPDAWQVGLCVVYWFMNAFVYQNVKDFFIKIQNYAFTDLVCNHLTITYSFGKFAIWQTSFRQKLECFPFVSILLIISSKSYSSRLIISFLVSPILNSLQLLLSVCFFPVLPSSVNLHQLLIFITYDLLLSQLPLFLYFLYFQFIFIYIISHMCN